MSISKHIKSLVLACIYSIVCITTTTPVHAQVAPTAEHIADFHSTIYIQKNGDINVEEKIKVYANNNLINHGIYRDIPAKYKSWLGEATKDLKVTQVLQDNLPARYRIENQSQGIRIYVGDPEIILSPGYYEYTLTYTTSNQLGHFENVDELYWNITGNGWAFPIYNASAEVHFPEGVYSQDLTYKGYVGTQGSTAENVMFSTNDNALVAKSEVNLQPNEGMTIAVDWPKGVVARPEGLQKYIPPELYTQKSLVGLMFPLILIAICTYLWREHGRDRNEYRPIPVQYTPPEGLTPAMVRFIDSMGTVDAQSITATLIQLASNGYIKINQNEKTYEIKKTEKSGADLKDEQYILYHSMFEAAGELATTAENSKNALTAFVGEKWVESLTKMIMPPATSADTFVVTNAPNPQLRIIREKIVKHFEVIKDTIYIANRKYLVYALPLFAVFLGYNVYDNMLSGRVSVFFEMFFAVFWNFAVSNFIIVLGLNWYNIIIRKQKTLLGQTVIMTAFITPFIMIGVTTGTQALGLVSYISLVTALITMAIFAKALPRRKGAYVAINERILGFRKFLTAMNQYITGVQMEFPDRFTMYEKYLPFAIALDVEPEWSSQFKDTLERMAVENRSPAWYSSTSGFNANTFSTGSFGAGFAATMAAAATNPSSSSGTSGGSSGGGGGGGGGGGW